MAPSIRSRFWRSVIRRVFAKQGLSVLDERARSVKNSKVHVPFPKIIRVERFSVGGMPCASILPTREEGRRVVLYLHGGGYVTGSIDASLMLCVPMARALNARLVVPEYRLAPEDPFPAALDDALSAYRWLLAQGYAPSDVVFAGDSAGGGLCLATIAALRDAGEGLPSCALCLSPWTDLTNSGESHSANARTDVLLTTEMLKLWAGYYAGSTDLSDPRVSPRFADFSGFPPILILVDRGEILLSDSLAVAERAGAAGVEVSLVQRDGLWHVWPALGDLLPESDEAFAEMRRFIEALDGGRNEAIGAEEA
ncbi:MAG: alpha/beta hydrolase [Spirochaetes bacterium]|nr:alpha/beta hydrolase [Spirochaetota bacterium]MBU1080054.1 alpha/beta hydrolase [Spirochaetota bacterium]